MASEPSIAAAGDIACPGGDASTPVSCQQRATSDLLVGPLAAVLALGDNQYNAGTYAEYTSGANAFDQTWGRVKPRTYPTPGNHEYQDPAGGAAGYFRYFGAGAAHRPGAEGAGWYSFDLGAWHILSINANCGVTAGDLGSSACGGGSAQERWVRADLAANSKSTLGGPSCILAFWHEPLYSSNPAAVNPAMRTIWQDLVDARADVVLSGHQHDYERFAPQDANGNASPTGITQFVVGTGGEDHELPGLPAAANSAVEDHVTFGVLRLTLRRHSYGWDFERIAGSPTAFGDSGSAPCH
ncbi:MAG: metallophosphoesterase [Actinobacteria bacterium]|nr:metallophosphoesterase [Actinomycetota bacterium]